ncbi:type II toxin-antitoxin system YoeB family toxin [Sodalis ligni]|nr:type II toxin-antitoxin system YoeB family toxin [Sodalis ligni]
MNKIIFSSQSWTDYLYWQQTDENILKRIIVYSVLLQI